MRVMEYVSECVSVFQSLHSSRPWASRCPSGGTNVSEDCARGTITNWAIVSQDVSLEVTSLFAIDLSDLTNSDLTIQSLYTVQTAARNWFDRVPGVGKPGIFSWVPLFFISEVVWKLRYSNFNLLCRESCTWTKTSRSSNTLECWVKTKECRYHKYST